VTKPDPLRPLGLALVVGVVLLQVPYGGYAIYPFKLLGTWLHESCHALAMLLTGAGFTGLEVFADGSGLAHAERSAGPLAKAVIAPAGYMGAPLAGVAMVVAVSRRWARAGLIALGVALVATALASISNQFGQVGIGATGLALLAIAALPRPRWHAGALALLAAQATTGALVDIRVLFQPTLVVDGQVVRNSDAHQMALGTFGTDATWAVWLWAAIWLAWSIAVLFWVLRRLQRAGLSGPPRAVPSARPADVRPPPR
jgi:hypothetical protein